MLIQPGIDFVVVVVVGDLAEQCHHDSEASGLERVTLDLLQHHVDGVAFAVIREQRLDSLWAGHVAGCCQPLDNLVAAYDVHSETVSISTLAAVDLLVVGGQCTCPPSEE